MNGETDPVELTIWFISKLYGMQIRDGILGQLCGRDAIGKVVEAAVEAQGHSAPVLGSQGDELWTKRESLWSVFRVGNRVGHGLSGGCIVCGPIPVATIVNSLA